MSEWKECRLGDVAVFQRGHDLPKKYMKEGTIPVAGSNGIIGYHNTATTKCPGVTIGRSGNIGTPKFYNGDFWAHNTVLYVKDFKGNDEKFVFYFLHTFDFSGFNAGSAVPTLNRNHIHKIPVVFPPLPEQRAIAGVLSSLDDKIDLLHRQNKTLEGMAEALWRKMFVEEADLEWKKGKLGDIAKNIKDGITVSNFTGLERYVALEHIERKHLALNKWGTSEEIKSTKSKFQRGDILFGKLRAYFHKVCIAPIDGICSTDILVIRPKEPEYSLFCLMWFFSEDVVNYSDISSEGTRMPRTNWNTLASYEINLPDRNSLQLFNQVAEPIFDKIQWNVFSIRSLNELHDTLLPKLMSGEVRVRI